MKTSCGLVAATLLASGARAFAPVSVPVAFTKQSQSKTQLAAIEVLGDDATITAISGGIIVALGGAASLAMKASIVTDKMASKKKDATSTEPEEVKIDLSIPYDAAARLAYDAWRAEYEKGEFNEEEYVKFKCFYEEATVMEVTMKKLSRDMEAKMGEMEGKISLLKKEMASMGKTEA